jgi:Class II Aldolase and Adducin N-terminal domain
MSSYAPEHCLMMTEIAGMLRDGLLDQLGGSIAMRLADGNILITPNTASFRRWNIPADELVVASADGGLLTPTDVKATAAAPLFFHLFKKLPIIGGIAHSHCLYSLVFASHGLSVPATTDNCEILGEIPCITPADSDTEIKLQYRANPWPLPRANFLRPQCRLSEIQGKHLPRYLGAFAWRFNRRFVLKHERLAIAAATTPPMPYHLLKLAEARW